MKIFLSMIGGLIAVLGLLFILNYTGLITYQFFAPKYENVRRKTFENTKSYVEGKRQEITKYRLEYIREKDPAAKEAIKETILKSFANFDINKLEPDQQTFYYSLTNN